MKNYILTAHERRVLEQFLSEEIKAKGFKVLLHRCRKNIEILKKDIELIESTLEKLQ